MESQLPPDALEELATFGSGKPVSKHDDPGPLKHTLTAAQRQEARQARKAREVRSAKLEVASTAAARNLSAANVGVVRGSLFDADEWRKDHAARQQRMETTFSRLYKPQANTYWTQKQKAPTR